ncbi:hypothetical protein N7490_009465 [Penicillium lividum]|nr:hypothetical protein N7490_009465 [Penicillium lividum]
MSESFAILRRRRSDELTRLADEHLQHELYAEDRDKLKSAASTVSMWTTVGSAVGIGLGLFAAIRLRRNRKAFFEALQAQEKPTSVVYANGRTESLPDIPPLINKPSTFGDFATYFFASAGGLFLGGELGFAGGAAKASRSISSDPDSKKRIETAFRRFRADLLRREADALEQGTHEFDMML